MTVGDINKMGFEMQTICRELDKELSELFVAVRILKTLNSSEKYAEVIDYYFSQALSSSEKAMNLAKDNSKIVSDILYGIMWEMED